MKLKIAESELQAERLRSERNADTILHAVQASSLSAEEDRRLKYIDMLNGVLLDIPPRRLLSRVGSTTTKWPWTPTAFYANGEQASCCPN